MKKIIAGLLASAAASTNAALIMPTNIVESTLGPSIPGYEYVHTHNGSGLTVPFLSGVTELSDYNAEHIAPIGFNGVGGLSLGTGYVVYDLGISYTVDKFLLWNDVDAQGINEFTLAMSDTLDFGTPTVLAATYGDVDGGTDYDKNVPMQTFDFNGTGRYVKLDILSNHGMTDYVSWSEVAVSTAVVPEPASVSLIALGLLGLVGVRRRGHDR